MAITVSTEPSLALPNQVYFPIVYEFSSNNPTIEYCVVEILVDSVRKAAVSVQPDLGTTDEFTLDISTIVQDFLSNSLNTIGSNGFNFTNNGKDKVNIKIYEAFLSAGVITTSYDPDDDNNSSFDEETSEIVCVNWADDWVNRDTFDITNFEFQDSRSGTQFLTESPLIKEVESGMDEFLGIASYEATGTKGYFIEVKTYDSSDSLLNTDTINLTEWDTGYSQLNEVVDDIYMHLAVGPQNMANEGISMTGVSYYTVEMHNTSGQRSETRRYNIVDACDQDVRLHWFNKYGTQESITFKGNSIETLRNRTNTFEQALSTTYSSSDRGTATIQNTRENEYTVFSKSIGRNNYHHALTILDNNMAYMEIDNSYFGIIIDDISVVKTNEKNMPIQFSLTYRLANRFKGLRG